VTEKLSSGSGGFWFLMYSTHTSSVTLPLLATQYPRPKGRLHWKRLRAGKRSGCAVSNCAFPKKKIRSKQRLFESTRWGGRLPVSRAGFGIERLIKIGARVIEHLVRTASSCRPVAQTRRCSAASRSASCRQAHRPRGPAPRRAADMADQPRTRCITSCLTPIPPDGTSARVSSPDIQKTVV